MNEGTGLMGEGQDDQPHITHALQVIDRIEKMVNRLDLGAEMQDWFSESFHDLRFQIEEFLCECQND